MHVSKYSFAASAALSLSLSFASQASAQTSEASPARSTQATGHDDAHQTEQEIVVSGHLPVDFGLLASTATLQGDALLQNVRGQLGETLSVLPGVSATSFTPGASRPVLRGFDGDRIRVLVDGIGAVDASNVSADHAVVFDSLSVDHIDVIHGPAVLLFGGQAVGGAVNAIDKRIPRKVPDKPEMTAIAGYGSAAREKSVAAAVDIPLSSEVAAHFDANWRKSGDMRVGGYTLSAPLRGNLQHQAEHLREDGDIAEADELDRTALTRGKVANTAARSLTLGAGLAFINADGNLGVSVQHYDSRYGVPDRPVMSDPHDHHAHDDHSHDHDHGPVQIDLVQTRADIRAGVNLTGPFESLQFRGAYGEYRHIELEGGEPGTRFSGNGIDTRIDLVQSRLGGWRGRTGVQFQTLAMNVSGPEAVTPNYKTDRIGVFTMQSLALSQMVEVEASGRFERATVQSNPIGFKRGFDLWSGAVGVSLKPADGWKSGINFIRGARAPSPEELLSDGLHIATQAYELGDTSFRAETSKGWEIYTRYEQGDTQLSLTGYRTSFSRFIAALPTGTEEEGLPVYQYAQLPAKFWGFEGSVAFNVLRWDNGKLGIDTSADYTHATLQNNGPVPRIPPLRIRGGVNVEYSQIRLRGEVEWNDRQKRVGSLENTVPSFTLFNLSADWHPAGDDGPFSLMLSVNNLFDVVGRRAASFTRDFVPLMGRDVRLTARVSF